ncbi:MAG: alpha/beta hydrolase [Candidatus Eremiobacteraeota bacterium]|nr:alpha/beta hydrolase [Candidatus Eremiobacteraeota bacterium]
MIFMLWLGLSSLVSYRLSHRSGPIHEKLPKGWQELVLGAEDGVSTGCGWWPGEPDKAVVLVLHPNGGSRTTSQGFVAPLQRRGYGLMLPSLRGHGDSQANLNDFGISASLDVVAARQALNKLAPGRPVVVLGRSLGAASAIFASQRLGDSVTGYLLESPFTTLDKACWNRLSHRLPPVLDVVAFAGLELTSRLWLPARIAPIEAAGHLHGRVILVGGSLDYRATPEDMLALQRRCPPDTQLIMVEGADHGQAPMVAGDAYYELVGGLLEP